MSLTSRLGPLIAMLGAIGAHLPTLRGEAPLRASRRGYTRSGSYLCACGRRISANKPECARCAGYTPKRIRDH